jgi:hypothetical protein
MRNVRHSSSCGSLEASYLLSKLHRARGSPPASHLYLYQPIARRCVHEWRQHAIRDLNSKTPRTYKKQHSAPNRKDGILTVHHYSPDARHMPINLEPLPELKDHESLSRRSLATLRPPKFTYITRESSESLVNYLIRMGKSYYSFYKSGLKQLWANRREMQLVKQWIYPFSLDGVARFGGLPYTTKKQNEIPIPHIYRKDFQLVHRTRADLRKLVPFGLMLAVCGEFTPIALIVLGRKMVPRVCYLPAQQKEEMDDIVSRWRTWRRYMDRLTKPTRLSAPRHALDYTPANDQVEHPYKRDLLFGYLVAQTNIRDMPFPIFRGFYWHFIMQNRLREYWNRIFCDTILIMRDGGFERLSPLDIYEYACNYGLFSLFAIMDREISKKNYDFINENLKRELLPVLKAEARIMLNEDFTKLNPHLHWVRAYRDSARWVGTPDVENAVKLLAEQDQLKQTKLDKSSKAVAR